MSDEHELGAGGLLRRLRLQKRRPDGYPWTQEHLAKVAGLSAKTITRAEQGKVGTKSLAKIIDALDLDAREREIVADAYNPLRVSRPHLDDTERNSIKTGLKEYLLELPELLPAYITDEYGFIRTQNVYILALHEVKPDLLDMPESWHSIAIKFHPKLKLREHQRDQWDDYYIGTIKVFRSSLMPHKGTSRYYRLIKWLKGLEGFTGFWDEVGGDYGSRQDLNALMTRSVYIHLESGTQSWRMFETGVSVSPHLPIFRLNMWIPLGNRWPEALRGLSETAKALGYRLSRAPFLTEKHLDESKLREIGGWIE
jgi:transcriptional regulator with XRE-family HTH domain